MSDIFIINGQKIWRMMIGKLMGKIM